MKGRGINAGVRLRCNVPWYSGENVFAFPDFPVGVTRGDQGIIDFHAHDFIEIVVISAGTGLNQLKDDAGKVCSYSFFQGDVFSILPGDRHGYVYQHELELYNLMFAPEIVAPEWPDLLQLPVLRPLLTADGGQSRSKLHLPPLRLHRLMGRLDRLCDELSGRAPGSRIAARALLLDILVALGRSESAAWPGAERLEQHCKEQSIQRAVVMMEKNLGCPLSLRELAAEVRLSPHYFCEQFRQYTGLSPWEYLTRLRLERARELLAVSTASIAEVAAASGFRDHSYFSRCFRSCEGISPSVFRQQVKERQF